jgi:O-antigen/teichoic acid export membrane protein
MLAVGTAMFGAMSGVAHLVSRDPHRAALAAVVAGPTLLVAVVVALAYASVTASAMAWVLAAGVFAVAWLGGFMTQRWAQGPSGPAAPAHA